VARPAGYKINRTAWEDLLKLQGLTVSTVAEKTDLRHSTISNIANGNSGASAPMAHKIAQAVGVRPATLFPGIAPDADDEVAA
jgi:transcriptional regulator with XRE-family HTH domain